MNRTIAVTSLALLAGVVAATGVAAEDARREIRILHLDGMDSREAVRVLRTEIQIRQIAEIRKLDRVIVAGTPGEVARASTILEEKGVLSASVTPHAPIAIPSSVETNETRVFRLDGLEPAAAATVCRAIYAVRRLEADADRGSLEVEAPRDVLDALDALFDSLGVLETDPGSDPEA